MYKYIIGCDADGVLTDLSAHNLRAGMVAFRRAPICPNAYGLDEMFDVSDIPKIRQYIKAFGIYRRYCKNEPPRDGASEIIGELSRQGYEFHSITARKFATDKNFLGSMAQSWFKKWLDKNNIRFKAIHFCSEVRSSQDKLLSCRKIGVDAMIEDKPDNALFLAESGIRVLMLDAPYNKNTVHKNITRVMNWIEIRSVLLSLPSHPKKAFSKLDRENLGMLSDEEKTTYFRLYQRHLQQTQFDAEEFRRSDKRFRALYRLMKLPAKAFFRVQTFGSENLPYQDGFIIACNHCDSFDQYRLGLALGNRPFVGYAANEIMRTFRGRLFSFTKLGIFIDRNDAEDKHRAAELMAVYTAHNRIALIFPEGTRKNKTLEGRKNFQNRFKAGVAVLAQKTGTGILPVVVNSFGRNVFVRFGKMIYVSPADQIGEKIQELELTIANMSMENITQYLTKKGRFSEIESIKEKYENYIDEIVLKG